MSKLANRMVLAALLVGSAFAAAPEQQDLEKKDATGEVPAPLLNPKRADDEKAIRALIAEVIKAFDAGDPVAMAATFTEDGQVVGDDGETVTGRDALRDHFKQNFEDSPGRVLSVETQSLKFLGPDTAIERGTASVQSDDADAPPESGNYTVVYIKHDGKWLQASLEDHPAAPEPVAESNYEQLKAIEWLVGDWINEDSESIVLTTIRWDASKNFLLQEFTVKREGKPVISGDQRIGWDPIRKTIRSWSFDSAGGFGEGFWSLDPEGRWVIHATGTTSDGRSASETRMLTPLDDHRLQWRMVDRSLDGVVVTDLDEYLMVRKPPAVQPVGKPEVSKPATTSK